MDEEARFKPLKGQLTEKTATLDVLGPKSTYVENEAIFALSKEHREYLLQRHGTLNLEPIPSYSDADPYNWPYWKKLSNLILVAIHAMMSTFIASSITPAYPLIAEEFNITIQQASYLTSLQIAVLGGAPLFWRPLSKRYGRRPIFLISLICTLVCNIGCAQSYSFGAMAACRAIGAWFISPAAAIGSVVVTETFFKKERARYMGMWTITVTLGVALSPFIFGFVIQRVAYRWTYYILAIANGIQFVLYLFLGPETRYIRKGVEPHGSNLQQEYLSLRRIDHSPFTWDEFVEPLFLGRSISALVPTVSYSMVFLFCSVMLTVEIPQLFVEKFQFDAQQLGLQFISILIGTLLGEQLGGLTSDWWMNRRSRALGRPAAPEFRLWLSYPGYLLSIVGIVIFLVQIDNAKIGQWNVTPLVGAAITAGGNQLVTTVLITYAVDTHPDEAASVGVFVTFVRQMWGFIGPFWFPQMFDSIGLKGTAGLCTSLMILCSVLPTIPLQFLRHR